MSISKDIRRLKEIVRAEQTEGAERLSQVGIPAKSGTIEEIIDKIPSGSAYTSLLISESSSVLSQLYTTL